MIMILIIGEENRKRNDQLVAKARELAEAFDDCRVKLIFFCDAQSDHHSGYAVDEIILLKSESFREYNYDNELFAQAIMCLNGQETIHLILFPSNFQYRELAAMLGAKMGRALLTDCTNLWAESDNLFAVKPALDGTHFSQYRFCGAYPYLAVVKSVETGIGDNTQTTVHDVKIIQFEARSAGKAKLLERITDQEEKKDIKDAELIFSGGRGMLNEDSFLELRELAKRYQASVGASRPTVDSGWATVDEQIGQTGSFVRPKVYLAFGISGAIQHIAGMRDSQYIIAVNNNKHSPIFSYSDYGIYADANSIIRNMLKLL
jgi:electron transfer flavoprotein alpha subunit